MHVFLEMWTPRPSWLSLSVGDRQTLMERLDQLTRPIIQAGSIEATGWGKADAAIDHAEPHKYFAVWRAPTRESLDRLRSAIALGGWYEFFDQVNVTGELHSPGIIIGEHISM